MKYLVNYTVKELVKENVFFKFYRKGSLYYETQSGFVFEVPVEDCGDGEFKAQDRGIFFMRYIRKQLDANNVGQEEI